MDFRDEDINGLTVSTVLTPDCGWETALGDADGHFHPVERYEDISEAELGHAKWVEFAKGDEVNVVKLGWLGLVEPEDFVLNRG